jgi:hypothetical protein
MNRSILTASLFGLSVLAIVVGCTIEERTAVPGPRSPDRVEVVTVRPSPEHVWIRGRWDRRGDAWVWIEGHWERR